MNGTTAKFVYDLAGRTLTQFDSSGNWQRVELYAGGAHLATWTPSHTYFPHTNLIGSERVRTDEQGAVAEDCKYLNYGELESCTGTAYSPLHYAGYERDPETGLDHMWFRYYNPRLGRFMSADPYGGSANPGDPQSLNRFAYVLGHPVNLIDPLGLDGEGPDIPQGGGTCVIVSTKDGPTCVPKEIFCQVVPNDPECKKGSSPPGDVVGLWTCGYGIGDTRCPDGAFYRSLPPRITKPPGPVVQKPVPPQKPPAPPPQSLGACVVGESINNLLGDKWAEATMAANIVAFAPLVAPAAGLALPGPGWAYVGVAILYDGERIGQAYVTCKTGSKPPDAAGGME